jgi:polygalacturonase
MLTFLFEGVDLARIASRRATMPNNVKDFGAAGDGITDDRQAIQKAIDDAVANARGGILFPRARIAFHA